MRGAAFDRHEIPPYRLERGASLVGRLTQSAWRWRRNQLVGLWLLRDWVRSTAAGRKARS